MSELISYKCVDCAFAQMNSIKLLGGVELPYSGGLVDCSELGVGRYPNEFHACDAFEEKDKNDS